MFKHNQTAPKIEHIENPYVPVVGITTNALMKMRAYVQEETREISWLGTVDKVDDNYVIDDVMLFEQTVTHTTTDIDEAGLSAFGSQLVMEGKVDLFNRIKMWGHSHVNMNVFASGTDDSTFKQFYEHSDFFIRLICNKHDDVTIDVMDCVNKVLYLNVPWTEIKSEEQLQFELLWEEFNKKQNEKYAEIVKQAKKDINVNIKSPVNTAFDFRDNRSYGRQHSNDRFTTLAEQNEKKTLINQSEEKSEDDDDLKKSYLHDEETLPVITCKHDGLVYTTKAGYVFEDCETVLELIEEAYSPLALKKLCSGYEEFDAYLTNDWCDLYDALFDWYCGIMEEEDEDEGILKD